MPTAVVLHFSRGVCVMSRIVSVAVASIAAVCTLRDQVIHPSINVDELDEAFAIELVREARAADVRYAVKLSAGFGGHNCSLALQAV